MTLTRRSDESRVRSEPPVGVAENVRAVVLGLGNTLLRDDGAGVHVIERLARDPSLPSDIEFLDGGTLNFTLLDRIESASILVVVDASNLQDVPGTVRVYLDEDMDSFLASPMQRSVHDLNLGDLLRMCVLRDALPARRCLVAIQPESVEWGDAPGEAVEAGVEEACGRIREMLEEWLT